MSRNKKGIDETGTGRGRLGVAVLVACAVSSPLVVADDAETPDTWYDDSRSVVVEVLSDTAIWFDTFFGGPRGDLERDASVFVSVTLDGFYSGVQGESEFDVRFRGHADLPRFKNKLGLVFSSDADSAITGVDQMEGDQYTIDSREESTKGGLGLAYLFRDTERRKFALSGGLTGGFSPDVYVAARYRYLQPLWERTAMRVSPTAYWKSDDGFGFSTLVDLELASDPDTLWRLSLFGDYGEETDGLEWRSQASWQRRLDPKTAIAVRAGVKGETEPRQLLKEGWFSYRYRRNFFRPWLFYELEPGLSWHHKEDYDTEPTFGARLEVQFYK